MTGTINYKGKEFLFFLFLFLQGREEAKILLSVSDIKQAVPSEMQSSCLMSSEAGSAFPLNRLSVFDLGPLSPTNRGANTSADASAILCADVNGPASPEGP